MPIKDAYDVVIIGGGAAGLMCAIEAGKRGRTVLVLEHNAVIVPLKIGGDRITIKTPQKIGVISPLLQRSRTLLHIQLILETGVTRKIKTVIETEAGNHKLGGAMEQDRMRKPMKLLTVRRNHGNLPIFMLRVQVRLPKGKRIRTRLNLTPKRKNQHILFSIKSNLQ